MTGRKGRSFKLPIGFFGVRSIRAIFKLVSVWLRWKCIHIGMQINAKKSDAREVKMAH
jgi:hypothetical protein